MRAVESAISYDILVWASNTPMYSCPYKRLEHEGEPSQQRKEQKCKSCIVWLKRTWFLNYERTINSSYKQQKIKTLTRNSQLGVGWDTGNYNSNIQIKMETSQNDENSSKIIFKERKWDILATRSIYYSPINTNARQTVRNGTLRLARGIEGNRC